jgi:hypothetical protein
MPEMAMQIKRHVEVLELFEQRYGEYLVARNDRGVEGRSDWSSREWAERERELRMLAPRADAAIDASGVGGLALHWPMALGGGVKADDLASLIFEVQDTGFGVETVDDELQQAILERIPSQIAGLEMRLEEAEEASREKGRKLRKALAWPSSRWTWLHDPNPWVLYIVGGVVAFVIGAAIWAVISA